MNPNTFTGQGEASTYAVAAWYSHQHAAACNCAYCRPMNRHERRKMAAKERAK